MNNAIKQFIMHVCVQNAKRYETKLVNKFHNNKTSDMKKITLLQYNTIQYNNYIYQRHISETSSTMLLI